MCVHTHAQHAHSCTTYILCRWLVSRHIHSVNASVVNFTSTHKCCCAQHTHREREKKRNNICNTHFQYSNICASTHIFESSSIYFLNMIVYWILFRRDFRECVVCFMGIDFVTFAIECEWVRETHKNLHMCIWIWIYIRYDAIIAVCACVQSVFFSVAVTAHAMPVCILIHTYVCKNWTADNISSQTIRLASMTFLSHKLILYCTMCCIHSIQKFVRVIRTNVCMFFSSFFALIWWHSFQCILYICAHTSLYFWLFYCFPCWFYFSLINSTYFCELAQNQNTRTHKKIEENAIKLSN